MTKLLLIPLWLLAHGFAHAQDSLAAAYINTLAERIDARLQFLILEKKDTAIYQPGDSAGIVLRVSTEYYIEPRSERIEKIVERTRYRAWTTELTVYYCVGQPIRFTSTQWDGTKLHVDFDVYYMNSNPVYFVKRSENRGKPDVDEFLRWCLDLLKSYRPPKAINAE